MEPERGDDTASVGMPPGSLRVAIGFRLVLTVTRGAECLVIPSHTAPCPQGPAVGPALGNRAVSENALVLKDFIP